MTEIKLTLKQQRFCDFYIENGGNGTEAAIRAGYSELTARQMATENLTKPSVVSYLKERNKAIETPRIASMQEVKQFWTDMLRDERFDPKDRLKASEYIAKTNAAFVDKVQHSGKIQTKDPVAELTTEEIRKLLKN